jgi:hypothetical protein
LLNLHHQEIAIDTSVKILKRCAVEEDKNLEPEPNERTMVVLKWNKGLGLTEADIKVSEDINWQEQQATSPNKRLRGHLLSMRRFRRRSRGFFSADFGDRYFHIHGFARGH